ncbi:Os09g0436600, partial [Oryza sativa Japonica Group]
PVLRRHHRTGYSLLSPRGSVFLKATAVDPVTPSSILVAIAASYCFLFPTASSLLTPILWHIMVGKVCGVRSLI